VTRPSNPPSQTICHRRICGRMRLFEAVGIGVLAILALAARAPFAISQLWAEDGAVFLQQAVTRGVLSPFGQPYAGYYNFVPRAIAGMASLLPLHWAATTTWVGVAVLVGWCAATITYESYEWLNASVARVFLGLSIVLLPALGLEAIATSSELQYTLLFTSLVVMVGSSTTRRSELNRVAIVAVTALTTPLTLVLAPLAVLRVLRRRPHRIDATAAAWAIATAVQFGAVLIEHPPRNVGTPIPTASPLRESATQTARAQFRRAIPRAPRRSLRRAGGHARVEAIATEHRRPHAPRASNRIRVLDVRRDQLWVAAAIPRVPRLMPRLVGARCVQRTRPGAETAVSGRSRDTRPGRFGPRCQLRDILATSATPIVGTDLVELAGDRAESLSQSTSTNRHRRDRSERLESRAPVP
jgi:hypothetical protein